MLGKKLGGQKGIIVIFTALLALMVLLIILNGLMFLTASQQRTYRNAVKSLQAYYIAESGIEDALLKLKTNRFLGEMNYNLDIAGGTAAISISPLSNSRTIVSRGNFSAMTRKIEVVYKIKQSAIGFPYGAQAGDGGIEMEPQSKIDGNVFSNGTIKLVNYQPGETAFITKSAIVARSGNKIMNLTVGTLGSNPLNEVRVHTCQDSTINGDLYYVSGGSYSSCAINGGSVKEPLPNNIPPENLPILDQQIADWKSEAAIGEPWTGDYSVSNGETKQLGPKKIDGNLSVAVNGILTVAGNLWITGNVTVDNGGTIQLDSGYGRTSGVIVADGLILVDNGAILKGSGYIDPDTGEEVSFIMLLSTNSSVLPSAPAVYVKNTAQGAILYASKGMIRLRNNVNVLEATGYKLYLDNNAQITYITGLINSHFSSGPGASWKVESWREVE